MPVLTVEVSQAVVAELERQACAFMLSRSAYVRALLAVVTGAMPGARTPRDGRRRPQARQRAGSVTAP